MKSFDRYLKQLAAEESLEMPDTAKEQISMILSSLPETSSHKRKNLYLIPKHTLRFAVCTFLFAFLLLPNISPAYARTLENIPFLGDCIRVITIRNYFYTDERHELNITIPAVEGASADTINQNIHTLTDALLFKFYEELEKNQGNNVGSLKIDYETITNTDTWFTLKLSVHETAADSNSYFKYYNIDKRTEEIITLEDLFSDPQYSTKLAENIQEQMLEQMQTQEDIVYWLHDSAPEFAFSAEDITAEHNFYFDSNGRLVIPFDQYEVAPGYMGCPSFVIPKTVTENLFLNTFMNIP